MATIIEELGFEGVTLGNQVQSVGEMAVLPLLCRQTRPVAPPNRIHFRGTHGYGRMLYGNEDSAPGIIPAGFGAVSRQKAQDHAMSEAFVVPAAEEVECNTAVCIQSSQCGYLKEEEDRSCEIILPITLRKALRKIDLSPAYRDGRFDRLWATIGMYLSKIPSMRRTGPAHLVDLYTERKPELAEFVAEFEPVASQVGAIVFFSGVPVGVEVFPDASYWERYWEATIRGCYGAEFLVRKLSAAPGEEPFDPVVREGLTAEDFTEAKTADAMRVCVDGIFREITAGFVSSFMADQAKVEVTGNGQVYCVTETNRGGVGDLVRIADESVYASIVW